MIHTTPHGRCNSERFTSPTITLTQLLQRGNLRRPQQIRRSSRPCSLSKRARRLILHLTRHASIIPAQQSPTQNSLSGILVFEIRFSDTGGDTDSHSLHISDHRLKLLSRDIGERLNILRLQNDTHQHHPLHIDTSPQQMNQFSAGGLGFGAAFSFTTANESSDSIATYSTASARTITSLWPFRSRPV
nr:MAG TPA: hypothetical protein [Caudoviricetes sp.]